ncbi:GNAT family N-acetyltransferase [Streptomyces mayteni]
MESVVVDLTVRDLTTADLAGCGWSGSALHLEAIARELHRAERGEADYLVACPPADLPVGLCGVDYRAREGAGVLWQLTVLPALRSCGVGTLLIRSAEARVRARGLGRAELSVEENNPRARGLYERLGYVAYATEPDGWNELAPDGSVRRYETVCTVMRKELAR